MKKVLRSIQTRHLVNALILSLVLDMLYSKYTNASSMVTFNWLSPVFGIIDLTLACMIFFRVKNEGRIYIPVENDTLSIKKSFLIGNRLYSFRITVKHLYNNLENWKFFMNLFGSAGICLVSILSLIWDFRLFFL